MSTNFKNQMKEVMSLAWSFVKRNGFSMSEAYGTLCEKYMSTVTGTDKRAKNDTVQTYFDTERGEFRCFKKANLLKIA